MSPARTTTVFNLKALVAQIVLDASLLRYFAQNAGKSLAALSAIEEVRKEATEPEREILDFLHRHISGGEA